MDNVRVMLRAQLPLLDHNVKRWNARYQALKPANKVGDIRLVERAQHEEYVGSSRFKP